jgi:hypothetical protein
VVVAGCASDYKTLRSVVPDLPCINKLKPRGLDTSWYNTSIDVVGKHISGLLLIKNMPDSSTRIVFTNEAGVKFLDFEFTASNEFKVHHIIKQLNKKPVIRLLRNDFALMLGHPFETNTWRAWQTQEHLLYGVSQKNEKHYFITDKDCASLQRIESGSGRKRMVSLVLSGDDHQRPDSIQLQHHTFAMQIKLRKLARD